MATIENRVDNLEKKVVNIEDSLIVIERDFYQTLERNTQAMARLSEVMLMMQCEVMNMKDVTRELAQSTMSLQSVLINYNNRIK